MSKKEFQLAIIIPVKNGGAHILSALDSVIQQSLPSSTLLVIVDVNSIDSTSLLCDQFKAKNKSGAKLEIEIVHTLKPLNPAMARNLALKKVLPITEIVAFLDHDDYWPHNRIISDLDLFDKNSRYDVIVGKTKIVTSHTNRATDYRFNSDELHNVNLGAATFRAKVFAEVGLFDEKMLFSEDHDYFFRMREHGLELLYANKVNLFYRLHETNMTKNKSAEELALLTVLRQSLERRKKISLTHFGKNR